MKLNKKKMFISLICLIIVILAGCFTLYHYIRVNQAQEFKQEVLRSNKPINEKLGEIVWPWKNNGQIDMQGAKEQIDYCSDIGVKYIKIPLYLNYMVSANGHIKNNDFEQLLEYIHKKEMVPMVRMWFTKSGAYSTKSFLNTGELMAKGVIDCLADKKIVWESTNEPNQAINWFNQDTATNFDWAKFDEYVGRILKQKNKNAIYIVGDLSGTTSESEPFLRAVLTRGYYKNADAISNHPYQKQSNLLNGEPEDGLINNQKLLFSQAFSDYHYKNLPLVTSEVGYSTQRTWAGQWSDNDQASYVARQIFVLDMQHQPLLVLFSLSDKQSAVGDSGWGLLKGKSYKNQTYKASGVLVKNLIHQLKGYTFNQRIATQTEDNSNFALLYKNAKTGKSKVVYWTTISDQVLKINVSNHKFEMRASSTPQILNVD